MNISISKKLLLLISIPILAFLFTIYLSLKASLDEYSVIKDMSKNTVLFSAISDFIHEIQRERGLTSIYLSGGSQADMEGQRTVCTQKIARAVEASQQATLPAHQLAPVAKLAEGVAALRAKADQKAPMVEIFEGYNHLISGIMGVESAIGNSKTTRSFGKALISLIILETAKENAGKFRALSSGLFTRDEPLTEDAFAKLLNFKTGLDANIASPALVLTKDNVAQLETYRTGQAWKDAERNFHTLIVKAKEGHFGINGKEHFVLVTRMIDDIADICSRELNAANSRLTVIQQDIRQDLWRLGLIIGVTLLVTLGMAFALIRSITRPMGYLVRYADQVAHGQLDMELKQRFSPELESLKRSLSDMVGSLKVKIEEAEQKSQQAEEQAQRASQAMQAAEAAKHEAEQAKTAGMREAAGQIDDVVRVVNVASADLSSQINQSSQGAEAQAHRMHETATAMEEMNSTVLEVARNASHAAETADQARHKAQTGAQVVTQVVTGINEVQDQAQAMKADMTALGQQAEAIGQVLNVITDIADQTNLLALNAAIEAARAGEAGRGFAVVADEVRKLAEKTMTATKQVGDAIRGIQADTQKNITHMEQAVSKIQAATRLAHESGAALEDIVHLVDATTDQVRSIATAAEEQSATSEEINRSIDDINVIAAQTSAAMRQSNQAVGQLAHQAQVMQTLVDRMKADSGSRG